MGDAGGIKLPQVGLQTAQHEELLNIIDTLRSQGISRYVDLPQLIVCGDQSSGKSSVLEAISGLRFPTKDNLCTRFATELVLRRGQSPTISVSIIPGEDRSDQESESLSNFRPPSNSIDDFSDIVQAAEQAMGLDGTSKVFAKDILRVELCGPNQPHLTLVDLPGIFWAGDQSQSDDDATIVRSLVESYMKKTRSIILAVVSAKSDLAMQIITKLAREIDPAGHRTLGIITKPDLLFAGSDSESAFVKLAKNENIYFKLGWHVLKNRDYDTRNTTTLERDLAEKSFFENNVWSSALPHSQLGIHTLKPRLSRVLLSQILRELPSLMSDVETGLQQCKKQLQMLGSSRGTLAEQRAYLLGVSQTFVTLMTASVEGQYSHPFFGSADTDEGYAKRLQAVVQSTLKDFAEEIRSKGHRFKIVDRLPFLKKFDNGPTVILRDEYLENVQRRMSRNRGRELPGLFNPDIVSDLFLDQAAPWQRIMLSTLQQLIEATNVAIKLVLEEAADAVTLDGILGFIIRPNFQPLEQDLMAKANEILKPHVDRRLLTFNHYFTDILQKKREEELKKGLAEKLEEFFGVNPEAEDEDDRVWSGKSFNVKALLTALTSNTEVDMDRFAAIDATHAMEAYYKVARKSIIDTFGMYAIDACLLVKLKDIFNPNVVIKLDDDIISRIAAESEESIAEREDLSKKLKVLEQTMQTMQRLGAIRRTDPILASNPTKDAGNRGGPANDSS